MRAGRERGDAQQGAPPSPGRPARVGDRAGAARSRDALYALAGRLAAAARADRVVWLGGRPAVLHPVGLSDLSALRWGAGAADTLARSARVLSPARTAHPPGVLRVPDRDWAAAGAGGSPARRAPARRHRDGAAAAQHGYDGGGPGEPAQRAAVDAGYRVAVLSDPALAGARHRSARRRAAGSPLAPAGAFGSARGGHTRAGGAGPLCRRTGAATGRAGRAGAFGATALRRAGALP